MISSARFIAVLDACVLYSQAKRDLLLHFASAGMYKPKWTALINEEWTRNLLLKRPDILPEKLAYTVDQMNSAFPDGEVTGFKKLIAALELPDADDRHVLAAAIRSGASVIVTDNIKDFPAKDLNKYDVVAETPDLFASNLVDLDPEKAYTAFRTLALGLKKPPRSDEEILTTIRETLLMPTTAAKLAALL